MTNHNLLKSLIICSVLLSLIYNNDSLLHAQETLPIELTLEECIGEAISKNIDLGYNRDRIPGANERIAQAKRALWPSLLLSLSENRSVGDTEFSQYDPATGQSFVPGEGFQAGAEFTYPIYDSRKRRSQLETERDSRTLIEIDIRQLERDIVKDSIQKYLSVLERQAECTVREEQLKQAHEALKIAEMRLKQGSGIQYEVLLEKAYLAQSKADLSSAQFSLLQAKRALLFLLQRDTSLDVILSPVHPHESQWFTTDELMEIAKINRLEFKEIDTEIHSSLMQLNVLQANRKPEIDLLVNYSQQGDDLDHFSDGDIDWSAGLSLRFKPFRDSSLYASSKRNWINSDQFMHVSSIAFDINDGTSILDQEMNQRVLIEKLKREKATLLDSIRVEVLLAYEDYQGSLLQLDATLKTLAATEENHRIQIKSHELGINQFKDVVDARTDLVSARIDLTRAQYTTEQLKMNLDYALGLLAGQESE